MSSNINSFFFKAENSNLTLETIRSKGYIAGETTEGFVEVTFNEDLDYWILDAENKIIYNEEHEERQKQKNNDLVEFLISGLKEGTPKLMHLGSSSFGGCFDDYPQLTLFHNDGTKTRLKDDFTKNNYEERTAADELFFNEYLLEGYFDSVGFIRDTSNHITEKQKEQIKAMKESSELRKYNAWKTSQPDLSVTRIALLAIKTAIKGRGSSYSDNGYNNLYHMERFLEEEHEASLKES